MCKLYGIERKVAGEWIPVNAIRDGPLVYDCPKAAETMARVLFAVEYRKSLADPDKATVRIVTFEESTGAKDSA